MSGGSLESSDFAEKQAHLSRAIALVIRRKSSTITFQTLAVHAKRPVNDKETNRIEAFSDGVFAIAMTLLVLEIRVPKLDVATDTALLHGLRELWPSFVAFAMSFAVVLIMWINHHELFRMVSRTDNRLLFANGFLMLMVTFIPFPTAVLAQYLGTPAGEVAAAFYCASFCGVSLHFSPPLISCVLPCGRRLVWGNKKFTQSRSSGRRGLFRFRSFGCSSFLQGPCEFRACLGRGGCVRAHRDPGPGVGAIARLGISSHAEGRRRYR